MRRRAKVDGNQAAIVDALRGLGCTVQHLHAVGKGCPDLMVGHRGRSHVVEVKNGSGLTPDQVDWHRDWRGSAPVILNSVDEAIAWITGL